MTFKQHEMTPEEMEQGLAALDELSAIEPSYVAGAVQGAMLGWIYGFLMNKPARGNRLKYGAYGAGAYMLVQFASHKLLGKTDAWAHEYASHKLVGVPRSPVVTSGLFAGAPRPLYHAVGAPPPGGDYSFTRRPGFNGKDY